MTVEQRPERSEGANSARALGEEAHRQRLHCIVRQSLLCLRNSNSMKADRMEQSVQTGEWQEVHFKGSILFLPAAFRIEGYFDISFIHPHRIPKCLAPPLQPTNLDLLLTFTNP